MHVDLRRLSKIDSVIARFNRLPYDDNCIDLSDTYLFEKSPETIIKIFRAIPAGANRVFLSDNELYSFSSENLIRILQAIPNHVRRLSLSGNSFNLMLASEFALVLSDVLIKFDHIDLSDNALSSKTDLELSDICKAFKANTSSLSLTKNKLNELSLESLRALRNALPHVRKVYLSQSEVTKMTTEKRNALADIFPNVNSVALSNDRREFVLGRNGFINPVERLPFFNRAIGQQRVPMLADSSEAKAGI